MRSAPGWVEPYLAVPYQPDGRSAAGADCWGLPAVVYQAELGIELPVYQGALEGGFLADLGPEARAELEAIWSAERATWRRVEEPAPFDLLELRLVGTPHVGLVLEPEHATFLHTRSATGPRVDQWSARPWKHGLRGIYRHRDR